MLMLVLAIAFSTAFASLFVLYSVLSSIFCFTVTFAWILSILPILSLLSFIALFPFLPVLALALILIFPFLTFALFTILPFLTLAFVPIFLLLSFVPLILIFSLIAVLTIFSVRVVSPALSPATGVLRTSSAPSSGMLGNVILGNRRWTVSFPAACGDALFTESFVYGIGQTPPFLSLINLIHDVRSHVVPIRRTINSNRGRLHGLVEFPGRGSLSVQ